MKKNALNMRFLHYDGSSANTVVSGNAADTCYQYEWVGTAMQAAAIGLQTANFTHECTHK